MDARKRQALEQTGWRFGDAADFLAMTDEERQLLDVRVEAALAVRRQRQALKLSQKQLASRIKTSQPRIAKIERAAADVSLEQILRAFAAAGGRIIVRPAAGSHPTRPADIGAGGRRRTPKTGRNHVTSEVTIELVGGKLA